MAMNFKNYADFIKSGLHAIPVGVAQPQMVVGTVLAKKSFGGDFKRKGNLSGLMSRADSTEYEQIKKQLENVVTLQHPEPQHPFGKQITKQTMQGFWSSKKSGFLGVVVPNTGKFALWMSPNSDLKYIAHDITTHFLKDEYLEGIINDGKWKPKVVTLKNFYIITEVILTSRINVKLTKSSRGGAGARLDFTDVAGDVGLNYSQESDGSLNVTAVDEDGKPKPFPIAFRTAHVEYNNDFTVKNLDLGSVQRGEDDILHLSGFVANDEKYHIGEFFLNADEDDNVDEDNDDEEDNNDEDDDLEPTVVSIDFDEASPE